MDMTVFGLANVAAITALCFLAGLTVKATKYNNDKYIPVVCGLLGTVLGVVALYIGVTDFPATDPLTAAAVGAVSGLAATGINQVYKQITTKGA